MSAPMILHRLHLRPLSPWRTPWQADTLAGMLCAVCARTRGADVLRERIIDPMIAGEPPFVLSDAMPGDLLPVPTAVRLAQPPPETDRKTIKRGRWLSRADFLAFRTAGGNGAVPWNRLLSDSDVFRGETTQHNTLARDTDASIEGGLFSRPERRLRTTQNDDAQLTLYFRAADDNATGLFLDLLHELSLIGFGADAATGRGQFEIIGDPEPDLRLDDSPPGADGVVVLSSFQPAPGDPTSGCWETFPKFGKLGPDLGLEDVRKNTLIMFRPGACFRTGASTPFLGLAVPMDALLPKASAAELRARGVEIIHPAFGLAVPGNHHSSKGASP